MERCNLAALCVLTVFDSIADILFMYERSRAVISDIMAYPTKTNAFKVQVQQPLFLIH